jgi:hypothetical protein
MAWSCSPSYRCPPCAIGANGRGQLSEGESEGSVLSVGAPVMGLMVVVNGHLPLGGGSVPEHVVKGFHLRGACTIGTGGMERASVGMLVVKFKCKFWLARSH